MCYQYVEREREPVPSPPSLLAIETQHVLRRRPCASPFEFSFDHQSYRAVPDKRRPGSPAKEPPRLGRVGKVPGESARTAYHGGFDPLLAVSLSACADEPGHSPSQLVSEYSLPPGVLSNTGVPPCPARVSSLSATVFSVQPRKDALGSLDPAHLAISNNLIKSRV